MVPTRRAGHSEIPGRNRYLTIAETRQGPAPANPAKGRRAAPPAGRTGRARRPGRARSARGCAPAGRSPRGPTGAGGGQWPWCFHRWRGRRRSHPVDQQVVGVGHGIGQAYPAGPVQRIQRLGVGLRPPDAPRWVRPTPSGQLGCLTAGACPRGRLTMGRLSVPVIVGALGPEGQQGGQRAGRRTFHHVAAAGVRQRLPLVGYLARDTVLDDESDHIEK